MITTMATHEKNRIKKSKNYDERYQDMLDLKKSINYRLKINIANKSRKEEYVAGRAIFAHICYYEYNLTYWDIVLFLNKAISNHTSVLHAINNTFNELVLPSNRYNSIYEKLLIRFNKWSSKKLIAEINKLRKRQIDDAKITQELLCKLSISLKNTKEKHKYSKK